MKYPLDVLDRANIYGIGTVLENNPSFRIFLDEEIDETRLREALAKAFSKIPYMKSHLAYDGIYSLEDNQAEFPIFHCSFEDRPLRFGRQTSGYMFQISYNKNELVFDWSHIATDGLGFLVFTREVLAGYYDVESKPDQDIYAKLYVEENYDGSAKKNYVKPQAEGFDQDRIRNSHVLGSAHCTTLFVPAQQILTYRKRVDATPAAIISALIAATFRKHLKSFDDAGLSENNNVRGKIVVATRKALDVRTIHNCYLNLFVTYTDAFDKLDFSTVCTIFRAYIDLAVQKETVMNDIRIQKEALDKMETDPDQASVWANAREQAVEKRKNYCNFNFSYLGELPFEEEIMDHLVDFQAICINENSAFGVFAYSFRGRIYLTICENYTDSDIISEFIELSEDLGISFEKTSELHYKQAYFELPD